MTTTIREKQKARRRERQRGVDLGVGYVTPSEPAPPPPSRQLRRAFARDVAAEVEKAERLARRQAAKQLGVPGGYVTLSKPGSAEQWAVAVPS